MLNAAITDYFDLKPFSFVAAGMGLGTSYTLRARYAAYASMESAWRAREQQCQLFQLTVRGLLCCRDQ